jgi:membrane-associated protease RseP (regulator of RpoE activity)
VHLNLPEDQGLVVESVVPESPAAKAGIEVHDIVIQAGDKSVGSVDELAAAVEVAKDTPLNFEIIHAGKMKALDVTPEKSPPNMTRLTTGGPNEWKEIEQWMQKMHGGSGTPSMPNMHFQIIQPGAILPQGAPIEPELPNNMSIVITHNGGEPAQIMVKWNDKEWNVSEKELDKLPPDVRPHVELTLGQSAIAFATPRATFSATTSDKLIPAPPPGMFGSPGVQMNVQSLQNLERQLDELNRKVDQLKKEIENLRPQPLPPTETKPEK